MGLTTLVGGLAFQSLIARPAPLAHRDHGRFDGDLRRTATRSIVLLALTAIGQLILRTLMMSEGALGDLAAALPVVLRQTHFGAVWTARIGLIALLMLSVRLGKPPASKIWTSASLLAAIAIALTTSLSGHSADWGDRSLAVLMDWLHVLAVSAWLGGLFAVGFVWTGPMASMDTGGRVQDLAVIASRFSRMAACCAAVFLTTGLYNAWVQVTSLSPLVATAYGWTFLAKLALVGVTVMLAGFNRYYFLPLLSDGSATQERPPATCIWRAAAILVQRKADADGERVPRQFVRSVRLEWLAALGVLACTALLTQFPPARHIRRHEHHEPHAVHRSMGVAERSDTRTPPAHERRQPSPRVNEERPG